MSAEIFLIENFHYLFSRYLSQEINNMLSIKTPKLLLAVISVLLVACNGDSNEDITNTVNKNGAIETSVHIAHLDSTRDVLTTTHKIWVRNSEYKTVEYRDTLPALGLENTVAENEEGDTKQVDVKKDYEIYITVK
jgi:hypothetical protein